MDKFLNNFKKYLTFELSSEQYLIDKGLKSCNHAVLINGRCLHCFKKETSTFLSADTSIFSKN
jgi:hypothetical protein